MANKKASQNLIARQTKPFIDNNLQFQYPKNETSSYQGKNIYNPIYSHYIGSNRSNPCMDLQVNETEFYRAMEEAKQTYQTWKTLQKQIKESIQNLD